MLNTEHFKTLAGNSAKWDEEMRNLPDRGESLCRLQESQSARGYLPAMLVESIYGWGVRYASGLQDFGILVRSQDLGGSRAAAIAWGITWANDDPNHREFYARKSDLEKEDKFANKVA